MENVNKLSIDDKGLVVSGDKIFYTLQGEGPTVGFPAVFLRLKICNLRCVWCDTPYAVFPEREDYKKEGEKWTIKETVKRIKQEWKCKDKNIPKRLVITGGEPMLQQKLILKLWKELSDWYFEIETNGTIMPDINFSFLADKDVKAIQFNCSPKLENSGNPKVVRYRPQVLKELNTLNTKFKFVVASLKDLAEIERDFIKTKLISSDKVILMPLGTDSETLKEHMKAVAEIAKEKGYRMLSRLQIDIWGKQRAT